MIRVKEILKKSKLSEIEESKIKRVYARKHLSQGYDYEKSFVVDFGINEDGANLISSKTEDGFQAPAIDLDFPVDLIPSLTEGHFHLYLNKRLTWEQYKKLLNVMIEVGLVQKGWVESGSKWGCTFLRKPSDMLKEAFGAKDDDDDLPEYP